jgi:hypothetical protein
LASADYQGLGDHDRPVYTADSTEIDEIPGVSPLSLADSIFELKLPALGAVVLYSVHLQAVVSAAAGLHLLLVLALEAGMRREF